MAAGTGRQEPEAGEGAEAPGTECPGTAGEGGGDTAPHRLDIIGGRHGKRKDYRLTQSTKEFLRESITALEAEIAAETDANEKADYLAIRLYFGQTLDAMEGQDKLVEEVERLKAENAAIRQDCYTKEAVEALLEEKKAYREAFWTLLHDMAENCAVCAHENDDFPCERCSEDESCFVWKGMDKLRERLGHDC